MTVSNCAQKMASALSCTLLNAPFFNFYPTVQCRNYENIFNLSCCVKCHVEVFYWVIVVAAAIVVIVVAVIVVVVVVVEYKLQIFDLMHLSLHSQSCENNFCFKITKFVFNLSTVRYLDLDQNFKVIWSGLK
jgi:hypothetical protein